jgi:hypothetical protein
MRTNLPTLIANTRNVISEFDRKIEEVEVKIDNIKMDIECSIFFDEQWKNEAQRKCAKHQAMKKSAPLQTALSERRTLLKHREQHAITLEYHRNTLKLMIAELNDRAA